MADKIIYQPDRPTVILNQAGHAALMQICDAALKAQGMEVLASVNKLIAGNILAKDPVIEEMFTVLNKSIK
jgi:hypothetical protein